MWKNAHKWGSIILLGLIILLAASALFLKITFNSFGDGIRFIGEQIDHIGKIKTPFSAEEMIDRDAQEVIGQLRDAGFFSVDSSEIADLPWQESHREGRVASVSISGNSSFAQADYFSKRAPVTVFIHKLDGERVVLTHSSKEYKDISLKDAKTYLTNEGFDNIIESPVSVAFLKTAGNVRNVVIGGMVTFDKGTELLTTMPVYVYYYSEDSREMFIDDDDMILLTYSAAELKNLSCDEVENTLKKAGFTNVRQVSIPCGLLDKPGTIKSVSIGENDGFKKRDRFYPSSEVVITRFSAEAEPTSVPEEAPTAKPAEAQGNYILMNLGSDALKKLTPDHAARILAEAGFANLSICGVKRGTLDALAANGSIQSILIGETEQFKPGAEFKKDQPVVVCFYSERNFSPTAVPAEDCLKTVVMEKSSDELKKLTLDGATHYFEALGFASVYKQPVVPGVAEPFAVNGSIKDIFIDECAKFKAGDEFRNARRVTITYYMK